MEALRDAKVLPHLIRLIGTPSGKVVFYALMNIRLLVRGLGGERRETGSESEEQRHRETQRDSQDEDMKELYKDRETDLRRDNN